jgi:glycosyltransferase involved in cell wall biosynthesis
VATPVPIVIMLTSFDVGGTEYQTVELARHLNPGRLAVHVACFHRRGPLVDRLPADIPIEAFPVKGFRRAAAVTQWLGFARWCRRIGARLVHTCDLFANVFGLTAAAAAGVPARIGSRREVLTGDKTRLQMAGQRAAYRTAHLVVANSSSAATQLRIEGVPDRKIRVIPNGVDLMAFSPVERRRPIRKVVMVANLRPEKGHDVLIDAARSVLSACPDVGFYLAGSGPLADSLAARARARGVSDRIWFLGRCDNVPGLLAESDLFVLPSRSEAMPNAVIEAMAAGLPIVATDVGGIPELVRPGISGVVVPPGNPDALAAAMIAVIDAPEFAARLGRAARERVERSFSISRMVEHVEHLYSIALDRRQAAHPFATAAS